jgi:hypothetical protein
VGANTICGPVSISTVQKQLLLDPLLVAGINLKESRSFRPGPFKFLNSNLQIKMKQLADLGSVNHHTEVENVPDGVTEKNQNLVSSLYIRTTARRNLHACFDRQAWQASDAHS